MTYCVKVRKLSGKKWKFLSSNGGLNPLRIHAVEFTDKDRADKQSAEINALHGSEYQAKVEIFSEDGKQ
jgi:hypothetical protein